MLIQERVMRSKWVIPVSILFCLLIPSARASRVMDTIMQSWSGSTLNQVIARWGFPTQEESIAGIPIYTWHESHTYTSSSTTSGTAKTKGNKTYFTTNTYGGQTQLYECIRKLSTDSSGHVVQWDYSGNDCPFTTWGRYKDWMNPTVLAMHKINTNTNIATGSVPIPRQPRPPENPEQLKQQAIQGNVDAQYRYGKLFYDGKLALKDYTEAIKWFQLAADQGHPEAQYLLGIMTQHGWGAESDPVEAYKWYNLSAAQGNAQAARHRDLLQARLSAPEITEAQRRSQSWQPITGPVNNDPSAENSTNQD